MSVRKLAKVKPHPWKSIVSMRKRLSQQLKPSHLARLVLPAKPTNDAGIA